MQLLAFLKRYHENKDLQDRNQSAKNAQEEVKTASTTLQAARTLVESLRGEVLADVSKQENASKTLIEVLKNAISAKKSGENTAPHNTALEVLNTFSPPTNLAVQTLTSQSQNPSRRPQARDVLDDVIASLRHARIQATQAGQTETIKNIDNALKFAFDQRGGLAYLRPASAYLRDVYAGSSLQNDPKLEWSNMLSEHMLRGVPVLGAYRANEDRDLREVRTEIDKQHWQTINSVRVAGAGNTNYVVAKDDIGNWYVKGYDADPAPIIRSAQNLALFNLGGKIGANLLARQDILSELQNKDNPPDQERRTKLRADLVDLDKSDGKGNTAGLSGVLGRFQVSYRKRLDDDFKKLQDKIVSEKLLNNLKRDWDSALAVSDFKTHLDKFKTIAAKDATGYGDAVARLGEPTAKPESPERAEAEIAAILDALRALRRYHSVVLMHIDSVTANGGDIAGLTRKAEDARSREAGLKLLVEKSTSEVIATQQTMDKISPAEAEKAKSLLDKKKADEDEAKKVLGKATAERVDAEKALADANKTADTAIQARRIARSTATRTILGFVTSYTSSRVESARQYEEVATFVTEAGR